MKNFKSFLILVFFAGVAHAQETDVSGFISESSEDSISINSSPAIGEEGTEQELLALAPYTEVAPGVCLVISAILADYCDSYPQDMSCQFQ